MNTKNNMSYKMADQCMKQAFMELVTEEEPMRLSVSRLCQKAGVNRSTFYAHYLNLEDMMAQIENNLRKSLLDLYRSKPVPTPLSQESLLPFLGFIKDHRRFYRLAVQSMTEFPLPRSQQEMMEQVAIPFCKKMQIMDPEDQMFLFAAFQAGFTTIIRRWVEQDCRQSQEHIASLLIRALPAAWKV